MLNKYGNVSGGFIFDTLDKKAHEVCIETLGDCVTAQAEIRYFREIKGDEYSAFGNVEYCTLNTTSGTMTIRFENEYFSATFTFIKRK